MQEAELVVFLPQDEEERVRKLEALRHVVPPDRLGDSQLVLVVRIRIHQLTDEVVVLLSATVEQLGRAKAVFMSLGSLKF